MNALILGATGLVGGHCLAGLLESASYSEVVAISRRPLNIESDKLHEVNVSYDNLSTYTPPVQVDHVFCAFGTTLKKAGSQDAMYHVDVEIPLELARRMKTLGATHFSLVSSLGANANSNVFYNRIKGELEEAILGLGFHSTTILRPSIIGGKRSNDPRGPESVMQRVMHFLPKAYRTIPAQHIARAMIADALKGDPGSRMMPSKDIWSVSHTFDNV